MPGAGLTGGVIGMASSVRCRTWPGWVPGSEAGSGRMPQAARSAAANSRQLSYRSAGALASAFSSTPLTASGSSGRRLVTGGGVAEICAHRMARPSSRRNGGAPPSIS